jgi:hypothetical protein
MRALHLNPDRAPRRKFRGKRRYFERVQRKADSFVLEPVPPVSDTGWEYWHYHADWPGWGNRRWKYRRAHIQALCTVFQKICDARAQISMPFQTWIVLDGENAGLDATYLHTPNARDSFPVTLADAEWGTSALAPVVQSLLPNLPLEVGWTRILAEDDEGVPAWQTAHWIYASGVGEPLRAR